MNIRHVVLALALVMTLQISANAAPKNYLCPQSIPEAAVRLIPPDQEWKPFVSSPLYLSSAAPADGPPERLGMLREKSAVKTKKGWTHTYSLEGQYPEGKWLRCDYGSLGEVSLAKRLPDDTQQCTVTGKNGAHAGESLLLVHCL